MIYESTTFTIKCHCNITNSLERIVLLVGICEKASVLRKHPQYSRSFEQIQFSIIYVLLSEDVCNLVIYHYTPWTSRKLAVIQNTQWIFQQVVARQVFITSSYTYNFFMWFKNGTVCKSHVTYHLQMSHRVGKVGYLSTVLFSNI